jgi:hypothetical protein
MRARGANGKCAVCIHPERVRIERLIAGGAAIRATAAKFGVARDSAWRHWTNHVSAEIRSAYVHGPNKTQQDLEAMAADESLGLLDHLRIIRGRLYRAFDAASAAGDRNGVAALSGRLHENLRQSATLTGEVRRSATFNVTTNNVLINDPSAMRAIGVIVEAVAPFAEARAAVLHALHKIEGLPAISAPSIEMEAVHG